MSAQPRKYISRPDVVEAMQWDPDSPATLLGWLDYHHVDYAVLDGGRLGGVGTLESGTDVAMPGDYVVRGLKDKFYICDAWVFAAKYKPADGAS